MVQTVNHAIDWEEKWSREAQLKQLPSLHGIVSKFGVMPGMIGMHGGLPPSDSFPFSYFTAGIAAAGEVQQDTLQITDPALVATAQQYNMNAQGYPPFVSWAHHIVTSLHKPATLQPPPNTITGSTNTEALTSSKGSNTPEATSSHSPSSACASSDAKGPIGMNVVITQGSSAGLEALFRMLLNPGDPVLLEEYTYAHVVEADLLPMGCELLPIRLDSEGLVPAHLDQLLTARQAAGLLMPRVLYTIPTGQNPTGSIMSRERMQQVFALAVKWDLVIIEDDAYYWLQYPDGPDNVPGLNLRPGFLSLDVDGRVVRLDTLAKLLGPGFRLGWLSGPPQLAAKFALYCAGTSIGANMLSQVMIHQLLSKWGREGFEAFVANLQRRYAQQASVACAAAAQHLTGLAEWQPVKAGMFMWLRMTGRNADSSRLVDASAAEGVMIVPGNLISVRHLEVAAQVKQLAKQRAKAERYRERGEDSQLPRDQMHSTGSSISSSDEEQQQQQQRQLPPCPFFRCSFVTVGPECIQQGFARLGKALIAVSGQQQRERDNSALDSQDSGFKQGCSVVQLGDCEVQRGAQQSEQRGSAAVAAVYRSSRSAEQEELHCELPQLRRNQQDAMVAARACASALPDDTEDSISTSSCSSSDLVATVVVADMLSADTDKIHTAAERPADEYPLRQETQNGMGSASACKPGDTTQVAQAAAAAAAAVAAAAASCIQSQQCAMVELPPPSPAAAAAI